MRWAAPGRRRHFAIQMMPVQKPSNTRFSESLLAAALVLEQSRRVVAPSYTSWQNELWGLYKVLGEFRSVVDWKADTVSRIRLKAARIDTSSDEPIITDSGPAVDILNTLLLGTQSQTYLMKSLAFHLSVPGECWLTGEDDSWRVCSGDELHARGSSYEIISEESTPGNVYWRPVSDNSLIVRIWNPDGRYNYLPDSPAQSALSTMRELELVSRHMQAQYLSRLASAGVFLIPDEVQLPAREEFQDAPDPFVREWIETAAEAIRTPGTAAGVVPVPMRVPAEYVESFRHIDFTLALDDKITEKRDSIIQRLARQLAAPPEILLGESTGNHWSAWKIEESGLKSYILPTVEMICAALTHGYLRPMLRASGMSAAEAQSQVLWYDASEITIKPDRSSSAKDAYDRLELSGEALRRESGFDEEDAPTEEELARQILKLLARQPQNGFTALDEIMGREIVRQAQQKARDRPTGVPANGAEDETADETRKMPDTRDTTVDSTDTEQLRMLSRLVRQGSSQHYLQLNVFSSDVLYHPSTCRKHLFSCPYTVAAYSGVTVRPGISGVYEIAVDASGRLRFGEQTTVDLTDYITSQSPVRL